MKLTRQLPVQPHRDAWVEIDLGALEHNARWLRAHVPSHVELIAVVKADAYGHGAVMVIPVLESAGVRRVAVASIGEALQLREAGLELPILVLGGVPAWALPVALEQNLTLTLFQPEQVQALAQACRQQRRKARYQIKVDTGMHRIGVPVSEAAAFINSTSEALQGLATWEGLFTHLACAERSTPETQRQWLLWQGLLEQLPANRRPPLLHLSNSAGLFTLPPEALQASTAARVGLTLFGYSEAGPHIEQDLRPALGLKARIVHLQSLPAGEGVSYGHRFVTHTQQTRLATLPLGYADGLPRGLSNRFEVLVQGVRCPQVGTVTMDQLMVDVSALPEDSVELGETATLLEAGCSHTEQPLTLNAWSQTLGTIPYELMCGLRVRLPRVYVRS